MKKVLATLIVFVLLGFLGWEISQRVLTRGKGPGHRRGHAAVAVEVTPVQKGSIRDMGLFTGTLYPRAQFTVAPKIGGRLEKLLVDIGDVVSRDQLVAVLDQGEYVQQVEQARAELEVARAHLEESRSSLDISKRELERARALRKKKIASESELDEAEALFKAQTAKHKVAKAQVAQKQAALKAAQVRLSYTKICVSCEGKNKEQWVVGERFVDEGSMMAPHTSIVSVLDIGVLTAVIHVIERDYPKIKIGQTATVIAHAFPEKPFSGRIVRVAPLLKETSRQARVEIEIPNPKALLAPGMFVRVEIEFSRHDHATFIPLNALVSRNGRKGAFFVDTRAMKARFVPVTLGIVNGNKAEVLEPTLSGSIVTLGHHLLEDGAGIILPQAMPSGKRMKERASSGPKG